MNKLISCLFLLSILASCDDSAKISEKLMGKYKFNYPSGQIEILSLRDNHTYSQYIFTSETDFSNNSKPLYSNESSWSLADNTVSFNSWMSICYLGSDYDSILTKPKYYIYFKGAWKDSGSKGNQRLQFYDQNGYEFIKIENR